MARAKTKGVDTKLPIPQNDAEAEQAIARLGVIQREDAAAKTKHDELVAALETKRGEAVKAFKEAEAAIVLGLERWASVNRSRLTNDGRTKTVQLPTGTILWREGRYSVKHRPLKVDEVVDAIILRIDENKAAIDLARSENRRKDAVELCKLNDQLYGFLRQKLELNKEAMLAAREIAETVPGVTVPRGLEEFAVEPLASKIREVA